jgi:hypothetical protein
MAGTPTQVEQAAARSEELMKSLNEEQTDEVNAAAEADEHSVDDNVDLDSSSDENDEQLSTEADDNDEQQALEDEVDWHHKYAVLQGKYNKEIPALQQQVRTLMQKLEEVKETPPKAAPQAQPPINPQDFEEYGEEIVRMANVIKELTDKNAGLEEQLSNVSNTQQRLTENQVNSNINAFYAELLSLCPSWEKINVDPNFITWLASAGDQFGSKTRQDYLNEATGAADAVATAKIFNLFKETAYSKKAAPKSTLEEQAAPKTSSASESGKTGSEPIIWKTEDIKKFYSDMKKGVYRHNPEKAKALEQDLFRAQTEGRISR